MYLDWCDSAYHARHAEESTKADAAASHRRAVQRGVRKPPQESRNRNRALKTRQSHPSTLMRAGGEGEMTVRRAADVGRFRVSELPGLSLRRPDAHRHRRTR